ncbi:reverse transcriptase domain-containing protein [Tanacetum coccineum]
MLRELSPHSRIYRVNPRVDTIITFKRPTISTPEMLRWGNLLSKMTRDALNIIENKSKVRYSRNKPNASRMNTTSRESVSKTDERIDKAADHFRTYRDCFYKVFTPAPDQAVEETCVTCGGAHSWYNCPTTDNNQASVCATTGTYNQVAPPNRVSNQMAPPGFAPVQNNGQNRFNQNQGQGNNFNRGNNFHGNQGFQAQNNHAPNFQNQGFQNQHFQVPNNQVQQEFSNDFSSYKRNNDQMMRNMQNQINSLKGDLKNEIQNTIKSQQAVMMNQQTTFQNNLQNMIYCIVFKPSLTSVPPIIPPIPNPKGEIKAITTRSGVAYEGPSIPTKPSPKKVVERETKETTDKEQSNFQGSTAQIPPSVTPISISEPDVPKALPKTTPIPEHDVPKSLPKPNILYPSRLNQEKFHEKASPWVSPVHCVPKKGGITVVANKENELIPTRLVTEWRVCIDYRKLNEATRKDHFPLPFMDQMLERLAGNEFYCFLDGFSGYFQIPIDPQDQEKTTFTCPYGTFAYRRMPFGLCNAPGTFQRCMMAIFYDMIEKTMEVFMDDFSIFRDSFDSCLSNLEKMLKREGIVLGHKISKSGIEVDRAKVDVIAKLPHPTTVKGVRSFLGHAGFYRRFIQDFSKIARPMTHLLEKETPFVFSKDCIDAFETLKKKLTKAPILVVPDWNLPFELMCDASDFAIGAVLGQRKTKHFQPIHYASKTMTEAQIHYTMTEKEMLAVVYAFEKFRPYLVLSKSIVYTDHSALKYLMNKQAEVAPVGAPPTRI